MGFIHQDKVEIHVSKACNLSLKYEFINKNGQKDFMYVSVSNHHIDELQRLKNQGYNS